MHSKWIEVIVGFFMVLGIGSLLILAYKVSDFSAIPMERSYSVKAEFENIGNLKVRSPVRMAGVKIGEISDITLNNNTFRALVTMKIGIEHNKIPTDSSARILTAGLLGSNYISITPGYGDEEEVTYLQDQSQIEDTYSAIILENLIGKFLFNLESSKQKQ